MKRGRSILFASSMLVAGLAMAADDLPTIKQVYEAAHAGHVDDAQSMMARVLAAQPNSAKAHFVEAELLAEQRQLGRAKGEFETAVRLDPSLAFAKPEAVQKLKSQIGLTVSPTSGAPHVKTESSFAWTPLLILVGIVGLVAIIITAMRRRPQVPVSSNDVGAMPRSPLAAPMAPSYGAPSPVAGGVAPAGGGLGSSIMTGLATGAAVGVGVVAAEAIAHRFFDGDHPASVAQAAPPPVEVASAQGYDMGGNDFGLVDDAQWGSNDVGSVSDSGGDWS